MSFIAFIQGSKVVATAGTPVALVDTPTPVRSVEIHARKNKTTANAGNVYVGFNRGAGAQLRVIEPGEPFAIAAPDGKKFDLAGIFVDAATSGDAVTFSAVL